VIVALGLGLGCGRIGYDPEHLDGGGAGVDTGIPAHDAGSEDGGITDAGTDAGPPECPTEMAEIVGWTTRVCMDTTQGGSFTYVESAAFCDGIGKRLCTDAEWFEGCNQYSGTASLDMIDDWEWVAELITPTVAAKRGGGACDGTSSHQIDTDPYGVRCCLDL
jgi:hypothetical protein